MKFATSSALLLVLACMAFEVGAEPWDTRSFNPGPVAGDRVLPMPCDGAMVFRRVSVPSGGRLDDHKVTLGSYEETRGYAEYRLDAWLAGGFSGASNAGERHYFIGKYEVTRMQHAALGEDCPDPLDPDGELPATGVTWAEIVLFAERYSEWLVLHAAGTVPTHEGAFGFLRLPTETEWEFAARGGMAVSPAEFEATTFVPAGESLDSYAIHDGNSYRELNLIGTRKPNPLGIYDMLGNAAELVLAPFRLNVVSHLHGQAGGFVRRGGSFRTRPAEIRTSHREEYLPVDSRGLRRDKTTGFRLVLVTPVLPNLNSVEATRTAWRDLQREQRAPSAPVTVAVGAAEEARRIAAAAPNEQLRRRLQELAFIVAESIQSRNQERRRAARESLSGAVFAARWVMNDLRKLQRWQPLLNRLTDDARSERARQSYADARAAATVNLNHYLDLLTNMAGDYGDEELREQVPVVEAVYLARGHQIAGGLVQEVRRHVEAVRRMGSERAQTGIVESLERKALNATGN